MKTRMSEEQKNKILLHDLMTSTFLPKNAILSPGHIKNSKPKTEPGKFRDWQ